MAKVEANDLNKFLLGLEIRRDLKPQDLIGWMPIKIQFRQEGPTVAWLYSQSIDFAQPRFFKQMIEAHVLGQSQWEQIVLTPIDMLTTLSNVSPGLEPTGFIFHVSRCGSTLLANMLMALPRNLVLVEPNLINKVLMMAGRNVLAITAHDWLSLYSTL